MQRKTEATSSTLGILDFDGSLYVSPAHLKPYLGDNSWLQLTYEICRRKGGLTIPQALREVEKHRQIYHDFLRGPQTPDDHVYMGKLLFDMWNQWGLVTLQEIEEIVESFNLRQDTVAVIEDLKKISTLAIITGAFDVAARVTAQQLEIDPQWSHANTQLLFDENEYWVGFEHLSKIPETKVAHAQQIVAELQPTHVYAVGDGESDQKLFELRESELGLSVAKFTKVVIGEDPGLNSIPGVIRIEGEDWRYLPELIRQELLPRRQAI